MWEMLTGQQAWVTLDYKQMVAAVLRDRKRPPVPPDTNKDCKDLLDQCWAQDPNDRPTFSAIVVALQALKLLYPFPSLSALPLMLFTLDIFACTGANQRAARRLMLIELSEIHRKWGRQNRHDRAKVRPSRMSNWWTCAPPPPSFLSDCVIVFT